MNRTGRKRKGREGDTTRKDRRGRQEDRKTTANKQGNDGILYTHMPVYRIGIIFMYRRE